jgi:DNA polymerase III delta subunit
LKTKLSAAATYQDYVDALKLLTKAAEPSAFPRLVVLSGNSGFLRQKAFQAMASAWTKSGFGDAQTIESGDLDQATFQSLWSQQSLFEPESLYILKRASNVRGVSGWLAAIKSTDRIKSHMILDLGDKMSADVQKQMARLGATLLHCVEPTSPAEYLRISIALAKRAGVMLEDDAAKLLLDSVGCDLARLENEIAKISLVFAGASQSISRADIAGAVGCLREDDVFELFTFLRQNRPSAAALMTEAFLSRGESPIAINGIFARYARDQLERGSMGRGLLGLRACAAADRMLKSSGMDESLVLASIIDELSSGRA